MVGLDGHWRFSLGTRSARVSVCARALARTRARSTRVRARAACVSASVPCLCACVPCVLRACVRVCGRARLRVGASGLCVRARVPAACCADCVWVFLTKGPCGVRCARGLHAALSPAYVYSLCLLKGVGRLGRAVGHSWPLALSFGWWWLYPRTYRPTDRPPSVAAADADAAAVARRRRPRWRVSILLSTRRLAAAAAAGEIGRASCRERV